LDKKTAIIMDTLFQENKDKDLIPIGKGFAIKKAVNQKIEFYYLDKLLKVVACEPKIELKLFIIDLVNRYALKKKGISTATGVSRQSIDDWLELYHLHGVAGLENNPRGLSGNKSRELEKQRKESRQEGTGKQFQFNFSYIEEGDGQEVEKEESPYHGEHTWKKTRYAGIFIYLIGLISQWQWFGFTIGYFGGKYKLFQAFLLMVARNIGSIEQTKHVREDEAGIILGIKRFPSKDKIWEMFYQVIHEGLSSRLLKDFFRFQITRGLVGLFYWFIDGHKLGYTGKNKVRQTYNTQRQMPEPGQTNMVVCDLEGNIVDFEIQEGKGDLKRFVQCLDARWEKDMSERPIKVFDREGDGKGFFSGMVRSGSSFVTWEKNADAQKLAQIPDEKYSIKMEVNGKEYGIFEGTKEYTYEYVDNEDFDKKETHKFKLRRVHLWNKSSNKRTCGLAYDHENKLSTQDCAFAILNRWGASENTFKHVQARHPYNYQPGFRMHDSENQSIANPAIKESQTLAKKLKTEINKLYKKLATSKDGLKKDGTPRQNSNKETIKTKIQELEMQSEKVKEGSKNLPKKIDVSSIQGKQAFKTIDNEGKNLFDFVTSAVWNTRNHLVGMLKPYYTNKNEIVDLFYAITHCHGWIKVTATMVTVRIEPLQQASRRAAQEQLCKKLTALGIQTPNGKYMEIEVGSQPI
jgi:hypothetical protein